MASKLVFASAQNSGALTYRIAALAFSNMVNHVATRHSFHIFGVLPYTLIKAPPCLACIPFTTRQQYGIDHFLSAAHKVLLVPYILDSLPGAEKKPFTPALLPTFLR